MIETVRSIYGDGPDGDKVFENLEFIQILIQKLCHIAYGTDLPNKVAMNIALRIVIEDLPEGTIRANYSSFLDALFHVLNITHEQLVYQVEQECRTTLDKFFEKVGIYTNDLLPTSADEKNPDREFQN